MDTGWSLPRERGLPLAASPRRWHRYSSSSELCPRCEPAEKLGRLGRNRGEAVSPANSFPERPGRSGPMWGPRARPPLAGWPPATKDWEGSPVAHCPCTVRRTGSRAARFTRRIPPRNAPAVESPDGESWLAPSMAQIRLNSALYPADTSNARAVESPDGERAPASCLAPSMAQILLFI